MRPLPEIRSRTQVNNVNGGSSSNSIDPNSSSSSESNHRLTNGSLPPTLKDAIVTRSKSVKLRSGRRTGTIGRSPLKAQYPAKNYISSDNISTSSSTNGLVRKSKGINRTTTSVKTGKHSRNVVVGGSRRNKEISTSVAASPLSKRSEEEGLYARHYKSYRRGNDRSTSSSSRRERHFSPKNCQRSLVSSRRLKPYPNHHSVKNKSSSSPSPRSSLRSGVTFRNKTSSGIEKRNNKIGRLLKKKRIPKKLVSSSTSTSSSPTTISTPFSSPNSSSSNTTSSTDSNQNHNGSIDSPHEKDKGAKRRSALWVLNCEAEEFLFGETAADKHELELPPSSTGTSSDSPPPKKRRRWRETELSHLLQTSDFQESKLRSSSSSSESGADSFNSSCPSPPPKKKKAIREEEPPPRPVRPPARKQKSQKLSLNPEKHPPIQCSSSSLQPVSTFRLDNVPVISNLELLSPTTSIRSHYSASREPVTSDPKTVQLRHMLNTMPYRFSFENPPLDEPWYITFSRPGDAIMSYTSFLSPYFEPVILPYEMDRQFRRSRRRIPKNSRKSPRCHASTLAILSSEKPLCRSTRNSLSAELSAADTQSGIAAGPVTALPVDASIATLISNSNHAVGLSQSSGTNSTTQPRTTNIHPTSSTTTTKVPSVSPLTRFMNENCISLRSRSPTSTKDNNSASSSVHNHNFGKRQDLSAQQYLWDSIQFLSDPYIVSLLAGEDPLLESESLPSAVPNVNLSSKSRSRHNSNYNNNTISCPVKKLVQNFEALERKASLRSCDSGGVATGASGAGHNIKGGTNCANSNSSNSTSTSTKIIPVPKSSPRNHSHGTNHVNGTTTSVVYTNSRLLSINGISKSVENRSPKPAVGTTTTSTTTNGEQQHHNRVQVNSGSSKSTNHPSKNNCNNNNSKTSKGNKSNVTANFNSKSLPSSRSKPGSPTQEVEEHGISVRSTRGGRGNSRKSPVVMISDIFKTEKTSKAKKLILQEELLFLGDGLPPLPSWPV